MCSPQGTGTGAHLPCNLAADLFEEDAYKCFGIVIHSSYLKVLYNEKRGVGRGGGVQEDGQC